MFLRATNGFESMSDAKLYQRSSFVISCITGNSNFEAPDPTLAELTAGLNDFKTGVDNSLTRDSNAILIKNEKRQALIDLLHLEIYYVLYKSRGSRPVAESSGFSFAKAKAPAPPMLKPQNLQVVNSDQSGQMDVSIDSVTGAVAYVYQCIADAALASGNWISTTCSQSKCTITGLTPGTLYHWRVAAVGTKGQILYSDTISRMAV